MKKKRVIDFNSYAVHTVFLVVTLGISHRAFANSCESFNTVNDVLNCALERHPSVQMANLSAEQAKDGQWVAGQRPNPEMNSQAVFGGEFSNNMTAELNLAHTFELGGKRDSRIKVADAEMKFSQAALAQTKEETYLDTLVSLYRLRQIEDELSAIDDALQTFARIGKQYRNRPRLNPDQKASLRIFEVAEQDYKLRRAPLESEKDLKLRSLGFSLGRTFTPTTATMPKKRKVWPILPELSTSEAGNSKLLATEAASQRASAELDLAKSVAWPDVKIGPTVIMQRQGSQSFQSYGLNLALPLPLYHRNAAGESYAARGAERAALSFSAAKRENENLKASLQQVYKSSTNALNQSASASDLLKKHEEIESLFNQGFLNGTVVIEIHRQVSDFIKTQNEQELAAVESMVRYYALAGKFPEVTE